MKHLIQMYIDSRKNAWAVSTLSSERYRLMPLSEILDGDPLTLMTALKDLAPYTRLTTWTRVSAFWEWLIKNGHKTGSCPYAKYREENRNLFKNAYQPKEVGMSFDEAMAKIQSLPDLSIREHAIYILTNGVRWCESSQISPDRVVVGKGDKNRRIFGIGSPVLSQTQYQRFRKGLALIGLTPHQLRKLFATRLAERGANDADLLKLMGWSSILTARIYLQPKKDKNLGDLVHESVKVS